MQNKKAGHSVQVRTLTRALIWLIVMSLPSFSLAEDNILFIGNSYTYGDSDPGMNTEKSGGVPGIFSALARAGGQGNPVVIMRTAGGEDFKFHCQSDATKSAIKSQPWTYVVLQDYSTEPTHYVDGKHSVANQIKYGTKLYAEIKDNNPKTRVILYETWSRPVANEKYIRGISTSNSFASTAEMQRELHNNYLQLANLMNSNNSTSPEVVIAPVGDAWQNFGGLLPSTNSGFVNLFKSDNYHGNDNGYYLAAAVFYSRIYGVSPHGLSQQPAVAALHLNFTVTPVLLEDVAWRTVTNNLVGMAPQIGRMENWITGNLTQQLEPLSQQPSIMLKTSDERPRMNGNVPAS